MALEGGGALLNHGFELVVVDVGKGEVKDVAGPRDQGGEEAVEEDGVEDGFDDVADGSGVCEDVEDELRSFLGVVHCELERFLFYFFEGRGELFADGRSRWVGCVGNSMVGEGGRDWCGYLAVVCFRVIALSWFIWKSVRLGNGEVCSSWDYWQRELERMTWDVTGGVSGGGGGEDKVFPVWGQSAGSS